MKWVGVTEEGGEGEREKGRRGAGAGWGVVEGRLGQEWAGGRQRGRGGGKIRRGEEEGVEA